MEGNLMLNRFMRVRNWLRSEEGQDMIEYVLLVILIALIVAAAIPGLTDAISGAFGDIADSLSPAT
jgi:Flp pilus assembly pilin Flp